jgi:hypothetical protein
VKKMKKLFLISFFLVVLGFSTFANAALIIDTGAPTNGWGTSYVGGWGEDGKISQWLAGKFTLDKEYDIYAMQGYMSVNVQGDVRIAIYSDNAGKPGTSLFNKTFMSETDQYPYFYGWQGTSGYAGHLNAGIYWIAFEVPDGSPFQGGMGSSGLTSPVMTAEEYKAKMATSLVWSDWGVIPQNSGLGIYARIYGNPVPIPGAFWLFAPGLAGLAVLRRRFNK